MRRDERPPPDIQSLVAERSEARNARDWARADALRDEIAALGWEVQDGPARSTARPLLPAEPAATGYASPDDLASMLAEPASVAASVQVVADEHPDDLRRLIAGLDAHPPSVSWEMVLVANAPAFDPEPIIAAHAVEPAVLRASQRLGWADARTLGMRRSGGEGDRPARHLGRADWRLPRAAPRRLRRSVGRAGGRLGRDERRRPPVRRCPAG
ncbi:MAG: hypothetical protein ABR593_11470 [Candidatus Limnocylindria bacterium]